jgi:hypothetical protein
MAWMNDERLHMSPVHKRMQMSVAHVEPGPAVLSTPGFFCLMRQPVVNPTSAWSADQLSARKCQTWVLWR